MDHKKRTVVTSPIVKNNKRPACFLALILSAYSGNVFAEIGIGGISISPEWLFVLAIIIGVVVFWVRSVSNKPKSGPEQEQSEALQNQKSKKVAYIANLLAPGAGNIYYKQPIIGVLCLLLLFFSGFLFFFGGSASIIGLGIIVLSVILAIPTAGLALVVGVPTGLALLLMGAGAVVCLGIWIFDILISIFAVYRAR